MPLYQLTEKLVESNVGGKAYHLSHLLQNHIPVPAGFVVSNVLYQTKSPAENHPHFQRFCAGLKSKFVMVRSSAIGEDGQEHSFAGQLDSFITANNSSAIAQSIQRCWDSLDNQRSRLYGELRGQHLSTMGVVVQEMIEPDYAGVLFTHSPHNYEQAYLEYVTGHAEKLVSGEVTPESLSFNLQSPPLNLPLPIKELSLVAKRILALYKRPQDIEWASKDGRIYIVQTRPITTVKHRLQWSNTNVNENYPDKLAPFLYSLARTSYYHYFKNLALKLKVYPEQTDDAETAFSNIIGSWGGRMYYNMSNIHAVLALTPMAGLFKKSFDDFVGYQKELSTLDRLNTNYQRLAFAIRLVRQGFHLEQRVRAIETLVDRHFTDATTASELKEYSRTYHQFLHIRFNEWNQASFADMFAMITHGLLGKVCYMISPERSQGVQNELLQAIPDLISNRPIFELYEMYSIIQGNQAYLELFNQSAESIWQWLKDHPQDGLTITIQRYLTEWGYRCSGELTFLTPNYCDRPASFIEMLKMYLRSKPENPHEHFPKKQAQQKALLQKIVSESLKASGIRKLLLPLILPKLVKLTCYSISCRERVRLKQAKLYYGAKIVMLKLGQQLSKQGITTDPMDIFFFEYPEISRLLSGEEIDKNYYQSLLKLRKQSYESATQKADNFASYLGDFKNDTISMDNVASTEGLRGLPACGGEITARVKILETMHEIHRLEKGDILVTRQTDPGWICAFPLIGGLIVERGGMLSHGAIVSREFGIPAIVGIDGITKILRDGQTVHLNAYTGVVTCLD